MKVGKYLVLGILLINSSVYAQRPSWAGPQARDRGYAGQENRGRGMQEAQGYAEEGMNRGEEGISNAPADYQHHAREGLGRGRQGAGSGLGRGRDGLGAGGIRRGR
jgi:hypothetical protein